jgi:D-tyrosyl-tRNA(Tyr) deacylase
MNRSVLDTGSAALVVSQFTLCADCKKGNRPSFVKAALPEEANRLYRLFAQRLSVLGLQTVKTGVFAADMQVSLENDGPVTILFDTNDWALPTVNTSSKC